MKLLAAAAAAAVVVPAAATAAAPVKVTVFYLVEFAYQFRDGKCIAMEHRFCPVFRDASGDRYGEWTKWTEARQ